MTLEEKITMAQALINDEEATDALLTVYLEDAKSAIFRRRFPFGIPSGVTDVEPQYEMLQVKLAVRYFLRRGGEGEIAHNENGINRTYGSVNDEDLISEVIQYAKVIG